jgi:CheY-like chemotaxis protein
MKILILDDDLGRHQYFAKNYAIHELVHVTTAQEAIDQLKVNTFDVVFLDHDLGGMVMVESGGKEPTGYDVAKWLSENPNRQPKRVFVHSMNPVGSQNIKNVLPSSILFPAAWTFKQD